ncbi:MAG TPA: nuclear transport factor 2 family protein [Casimicrobiaceae bacterium]
MNTVLYGVKAALCIVLVVFAAGNAAAQGARIPTDAVDGFHAALRNKDTAAALSLLDRGLVVFEFGVADPTAEAYAFQHLPRDIDVAVATQWKLESRRIGGEGSERWVLSTYHVTGTLPDGTPIDQTLLETAILRRTGDAFRIVHLHWSTNDPALAAQMQVKGAQGKTR